MHTIESKETIVRSQWCFKKNLLGHLLQNGTFQLIRVNYKAIRIKELTNSTDHTKMYTCFAFSPNNDQIAAGNNKGGFIIANIGDHFEINKRLHKDSLYWIKWLSLARSEELRDINPLAKNSNLDKFLPQIEAHKGSVADNIMKLNIFNSMPESYTLLVSLDTDSVMGLVLNGYFEITKFDMKSVLHRRQAPNLFIHEILFEKTRDTMLVYHSEGGNIHKNMYLSLVDCSFLRYSKETVVVRHGL